VCQGCFIRPTIFLDPKQDAKIVKEEIFGPVVAISDFTDEDEAVTRANATEFGLSGAVFTQDINRALRVAAKVQSGTMCINSCLMVDATVPFGGFKQSGWGRENGKVWIQCATC
jgi:acyl-CoA reductase-like NAD-dependent aldehyde dehydrogenase